MGRFGYQVIDADGHGGEYEDWRKNVPAEWQPRLAEYRDRVAKHYSKLVLPGASHFSTCQRRDCSLVFFMFGPSRFRVRVMGRFLAVHLLKRR